MSRTLDCMILAMTVSALKVGNDFKKYNDQGRSETILTSTHMGPYGFKNFPQKKRFCFPFIHNIGSLQACSGASNENVVQNHLNITLLNVF